MTKKHGKPRGRKNKYYQYEQLLSDIPAKSMTKRPRYVDGVGIFRGKQGDTVFVKLLMRHGGVYKGKSYVAGQYLEVKLGVLKSFSWQEVEEARDRLQGKADRGEPLEDVISPLFEEYALQWLEQAKTRLVHRGYLNTKGVIRNELFPHFGQKTLKHITASDINSWQSRQLESYKPATVKRRRVVLFSILSAALKDGLITENPSSRVNTVRVPERPPRYIKEQELKLLIDKASEIRPWLRDYLLWGLHSGMRQGEVRNIKWSDIVYPIDGLPYIQVVTGKTHKVRNVTCSPEMLDILARQKERVEGNEKMFPYAESTVRIAWNQLRTLVRVPDITVQNLRTTAATYGAMAGIPLRTLAGRLGHGDMKMLEKYYAGLVGSSEAFAARKISKTIDDLIGH